MVRSQRKRTERSVKNDLSKLNVKGSGKAQKKSTVTKKVRKTKPQIKCAKCSKPISGNDSKNKVCAQCLKNIATVSKKNAASKQKPLPSTKIKTTTIKSNSKESTSTRKSDTASGKLKNSKALTSPNETNKSAKSTANERKSSDNGNTTKTTKRSNSVKSPQKLDFSPEKKMGLRGKKRSYVQLASGVSEEEKPIIKKAKTAKDVSSTVRGARNKKPTPKATEWLSTKSPKIKNNKKETKQLTSKNETKSKSPKKKTNSKASPNSTKSKSPYKSKTAENKKAPKSALKKSPNHSNNIKSHSKKTSSPVKKKLNSSQSKGKTTTPARSSTRRQSAKISNDSKASVNKKRIIRKSSEKPMSIDDKKENSVLKHTAEPNYSVLFAKEIVEDILMSVVNESEISLSATNDVTTDIRENEADLNDASLENDILERINDSNMKESFHYATCGDEKNMTITDVELHLSQVKATDLLDSTDNAFELQLSPDRSIELNLSPGTVETENCHNKMCDGGTKNTDVVGSLNKNEGINEVDKSFSNSPKYNEPQIIENKTFVFVGDRHELNHESVASGGKQNYLKLETKDNGQRNFQDKNADLLDSSENAFELHLSPERSIELNLSPGTLETEKLHDKQCDGGTKNTDVVGSLNKNEEIKEVDKSFSSSPKHSEPQPIESNTFVFVGDKHESNNKSVASGDTQNYFKLETKENGQGKTITFNSSGMLSTDSGQPSTALDSTQRIASHNLPDQTHPHIDSETKHNILSKSLINKRFGETAERQGMFHEALHDGCQDIPDITLKSSSKNSSVQLVEKSNSSHIEGTPVGDKALDKIRGKSCSPLDTKNQEKKINFMAELNDISKPDAGHLVSDNEYSLIENKNEIFKQLEENCCNIESTSDQIHPLVNNGTFIERELTVGTSLDRKVKTSANWQSSKKENSEDCQSGGDVSSIVQDNLVPNNYIKGASGHDYGNVVCKNTISTQNYNVLEYHVEKEISSSNDKSITETNEQISADTASNNGEDFEKENIVEIPEKCGNDCSNDNNVKLSPKDSEIHNSNGGKLFITDSTKSNYCEEKKYISLLTSESVACNANNELSSEKELEDSKNKTNMELSTNGFNFDKPNCDELLQTDKNNSIVSSPINKVESRSNETDGSVPTNEINVLTSSTKSKLKYDCPKLEEVHQLVNKSSRSINSNLETSESVRQGDNEKNVNEIASTTLSDCVYVHVKTKHELSCTIEQLPQKECLLEKRESSGITNNQMKPEPVNDLSEEEKSCQKEQSSNIEDNMQTHSKQTELISSLIVISKDEECKNDLPHAETPCQEEQSNEKDPTQQEEKDMLTIPIAMNKDDKSKGNLLLVKENKEERLTEKTQSSQINECKPTQIEESNISSPIVINRDDVITNTLRSEVLVVRTESPMVVDNKTDSENYDEMALKVEEVREESISIDGTDVESMQCNSETRSSNRMSVDEEVTIMDIDQDDAAVDGSECQNFGMKVGNELNMEVN